MLVTQAVGILFLSFMLWLYWKLISQKQHNRSVKDAVLKTFKISIICELFLLLLFLYAIPAEHVYTTITDKLVAALLLSINSFNNAGLAHVSQFLDPVVLQQNFIVQIGVVTGSTLGSLGIFVIDELLSPRQLRKRLDNPDIDWSLLSKLSVFGATMVSILFSGIFYFQEHDHVLSDKNLIESIIASFYEVSSSRGFGAGLFEASEHGVVMLSSIFSAGIFSTGSGFTLLLLLVIIAFTINKSHRNTSFDRLLLLGKNLFVYTMISFGILLTIAILINSISSADLSIRECWNMYSTNHALLNLDTPWYIDIFKSIINVAGRTGFIISCYITYAQLKI